MANHSPFFKATRISAAVAICIASSAWAQQNPTEITIIDKIPARVSGFGDVPAKELPFSTTTIDSATLRDIGAQRLSDALRLDASVADAFNSPAYWDILSVRGFTLDNRYNYRREGMAISAETMIPMDNKERIELLKGTSGIQAGTSSPGGLVNYVVKRAPTNADQTIRNMTFSYGQGNNRSAAADLGGRFGETSEFGYRFNIAHEDLDPYIRDTKGNRDLVALAMDWRLKPGTVLDFEVEHSRREQIGVIGYSLLDGVLPTPVDPRVNLTRQSWSVPGVFNALTGSIRLRQELNDGWQWTTQYGVQRLKSDDRLTFAYGYNGGPLGNGYLAQARGPLLDQTTQRTDQFTREGRYEIDDFRSDNEKRLMDVAQTEVSGVTEINGLKNHLTLGVLRQRQLDRLPPMQAWNPAGEGSVFGGSSASPSPEPLTANTNRSEYSNELTFKDRIELTTKTTVWMGLRHVEFNRLSTQNDGSQQRRYEGNINLPWIGASTTVENKTIYASHGHGIEQFVAPNTFLWKEQAGQQLGVGRSRQTEVGMRSIASQGSVGWNAAVFQIDRPLAYDEKLSGSDTGYFKRHLDGKQTHQGLELGANLSTGQWRLGSQAQWLYAKISGVEQTPDSVGTTPLNVPKFVLRGMAEYRYASVPGLRSGLRVSHEGQRNVTEDGNVMLPSWTTFDASAHYDTKVNNIASTWTLAIDNLEDKRYWRESPKQFGHYYLYPGAPRTIRATVQFRL
jgi:iron complex outermembrane recepter protein